MKSKVSFVDFDSSLMVCSIGNLENWWAPDTVANFRDRADCIIRQYEDFVHPQVGLNLNGVMTQGENIADNGGIKEAFYGYCE